MVQPKVSVVVAVYNAERTLRRCLDSLVAQTLQEIEFICVDDGSTDSSPAILDSYMVADSRFKVYHNSNQGVSATRQFGIDHVIGNYVIHLDSDDFVEPTIYERLYDTAVAGQADIVICDALQITESGIKAMDYASEDYSAHALIKRMFSWETSALWNRLIRTELIRRYNLCFPGYLQLAEDRYFLVCLLSRSLKEGDSLSIVHLAEALVHYDTTANPTSLTKSLSEKTIFSRMVESYRILVTEVDMACFGKDFYSFVLGMAFNAYWKFNRNDLDENDYLLLFTPFEQGFRQYVAFSYRKTLVLLALKRGVRYAQYFRWVAVPAILRDRIKS